VSVLMPVKNGARHLGAALHSVARQTVIPDEVVLVDDASADATFAVMHAWKNRLPITVVRGVGKGIAAALNAGLERCTGELIARMDSDDVMHPRRLELQVAHLETHPEEAVCGTGVVSFPPSRVSNKRAAYDAWISSLRSPEEHARDIYVEAPLAHPTVMLRAEALRSVGGYHAVPWPEDYDLWLRLHGAGYKMGKPDGILHFWREREDRLSRTH